MLEFVGSRGSCCNDVTSDRKLYFRAWSWLRRNFFLTARTLNIVACRVAGQHAFANLKVHWRHRRTTSNRLVAKWCSATIPRAKRLYPRTLSAKSCGEYSKRACTHEKLCWWTWCGVPLTYDAFTEIWHGEIKRTDESSVAERATFERSCMRGGSLPE